MKRKGNSGFILALLVFLVAVFIITGCAVLSPDNDNDRGGGFSGGLFGGGDGNKVMSSVMLNPTTSLEWLEYVMDQYHYTFDVYTDADSPGNHFLYYGGIGTALTSLDLRYQGQPYSGDTCIQATSGNAWGGFFFMNGVMSNGMSSPIANWGVTPDAGIDLGGATTVTFWARGQNGGETAEFFCGGVGWSGINKVTAYPDSFYKTSTGDITLTANWQQYSIDVSARDLSYVLGGFGFAIKQPNQTIYIDQIQYDKPRLNEARLLRSYRTITPTNSTDVAMKSVAYTYDNAMAILAFLNAGEYGRARLVADALLYAQDHDRYYTDGRLRNAYKAGDLKLPSGWIVNSKTATAAIPNSWNSSNKSYQEDEFNVSSDTGNQAWAMLAWLSCYSYLGDAKYLNAAVRLGDWVEANLRDTQGAGGYLGKYKGWEPAEKQTYKSTEHNLDLYAAFLRLYQVTSDSKWLTRANYASNFCMTMWDSTNGRFYAGTRADGTLAFGNGDEPIPLDAQPWMLLAFRTLPPDYQRGLTYAENNCKYPGTWGFDFNILAEPAGWNPGVSHPDGIWYEGTAQMAAAYNLTGQTEKYANVLSTISAGKPADGGMYACGPDGKESISTGFWTSAGQWLYFRRQHVGATAWTVLAEAGANPFWLYTNSVVSSSSSSSSSVSSMSSSSSSVSGDTNNYAVFSETVGATERYRFDVDGHLYIWHNMTINSTIAAYEGIEAWDLYSSGTSWWGMGITVAKDLSMYTQGSLHFTMKTTNQDTFKVGFKNGGTEYWLDMYADDSTFGLVRDGQWHDVSIPFAYFGNPAMNNITQLFMIADSYPQGAFSAKLDNIYYKGQSAGLSGLYNAALGTVPNQSSVYATYSGTYGWSYNSPAYAVDNSTSSTARTLADTNAWWETDLGRSLYIESVEILAGGSGTDMLSNYYVFISEVPFTSSDLSTTLNQSGVAKYFFSGESTSHGAFKFRSRGRYIRIQRTEVKQLWLNEVRVFALPSGATPPTLANAAIGTVPNQCSVYATYSGTYGWNVRTPSRAVDNDLSYGATPAVTLGDTNAWWETDLGTVKSISNVRLYLWSNKLKNFYVFVSQNPFQSPDLDATKNQAGVTKIFVSGDAGVIKTVNIGAQGRYVRIQRTDADGLGIIEAQIYIPSSEVTTPPTLANAAIGTVPNQCSVYATYSGTYGWNARTPSRAVDNNASYGENPALTLSETNAWWETDLGSVKNISNIRLYLWGTELKNFYVFVSQTPFQSPDLNTTMNQAGVTKIFVSGDAGVVKTVNIGVQGRYVRIQRTDVNYLQLDEVQVFIPQSEMTTPPTLANAALGTVPNQSSVYATFDSTRGWFTRTPGCAVDNNCSYGALPALTLCDSNAWWETDLGAVKNIDSIRLYLWGTELKDCYVFVSQTPFQSPDLNTTMNQAGVTKIFVSGDAGVVKTVNIGVQGRYVRIQRTDVNYLQLDEVQVFIPQSEMTTPPTLANAALGTVPNQSSTYRRWDNVKGWIYYSASRANDNSASLNYLPALTLSDTNAWWETDLGAVKSVDSVRLYLLWDELKNCYVFVSQNPFQSPDLNATLSQAGVTKIYVTGDAGVVKTVNIGALGRYVRIQRTDVSTLQIYEAQVLVSN